MKSEGVDRSAAKEILPETRSGSMQCEACAGAIRTPDRPTAWFVDALKLNKLLNLLTLIGTRVAHNQ